MKQLILVLLAVPFALFSQADQADFDRMVESRGDVLDVLARAARELTDRAAEEVRSRRSWEPHRKQRLEEMRDMLGLLPWPERTPLNPQITGRLAGDGYVVEKLAFESLPQVYVTANLYLPQGWDGPRPAVVYVCGHAYSPDGNKTSYQRHGISLAKNGYVAIILDSLQVAETFALHHGVFNQEMDDWYARGYSPAGPEVWNAIRAIDYLETRPEVDAERIGMTGRSGGAAMTWFTAAVDPRVKAAVPVMGISTYAANVADDTQKRHCDCMFLVNALRHGMLHQGALIAPRPLLMAHGKQDLLFPVDGYEEFEERIGALYASYDRFDDFDNVVVDTAHQDSEFLRGKAIEWFDRKLMGVEPREIDLTYEDADPESLRVFADGPPADARNYRLHEEFLPAPKLGRYVSRAAWEQRRTEVLDALRNVVFGAFPDKPVALEMTLPTEIAETGFEEIVFTSEPGIRIRALKTQPDGEDKLPVLLYVASDGDDAATLGRMFRVARRGTKVMRVAVYPRGVGPVGWSRSFWKRVQRNAMHVGQTVDSMRLWDVMRAVEAVRQLDGADPDRITIAGQGTAGVLGLYAALLDERVSQVLLMYPPESHVEGPLFLNVLRHLDIPEAAALLAPRRINFYGRMPEAFEPVRGIYDLYGKPGHVFLTMDLFNVATGTYDHDFAAGL